MIVGGTVLGARGGMIEARLPCAAVGSGVRVLTARGEINGVVTALRAGCALIAAHDAVDGVAKGDVAFVDPAALTMPLGTIAIGRCIDGRGVPLDGQAALRGPSRSVNVESPLPSERAPIERPCWTGVRAIDGLLTFGFGARIGIFGPAGAGKSTLLHSLLSGTRTDAVVVGLVGERGREAEEWMRNVPAHASIVCATSDRSAAERVRAARVAMAQANALRSRGLHVLFVLDSLARFGAALREIAVASGEVVGRAGYPATVFSDLARFVEIAGAAHGGSITLVATVLSDGDERDPLSDAARSLLDGHVQLSAARSREGRFPAIDVVASASRTMKDVVAPAHADAAAVVRSAIALLQQTSDAWSLGIESPVEAAQRARAAETGIERFLCQDGEPSAPPDTLSSLYALADTLR